MVVRKKAKTTRRFKRYRRYPGRRRGYGRGGRSTRRIARRAYRIAKRIQSSIETKYSLVNSGATGPAIFAISTVPTNIELTNLGQGDGYNNRDGLQVMFTRIVGTWQAEYGDTYNYIRVVIWKPLDFTPYTTSDIVTYYVDNVGSLDVAAFREWPLRKSIKVLWSKLIYLDPTNYPLRRGNFSIKIRNKVLYSDGGATIASVSKGPLFMSYWSDSGAVPHPKFGFYIRMYFQDL